MKSPYYKLCESITPEVSLKVIMVQLDSQQLPADATDVTVISSRRWHWCEPVMTQLWGNLGVPGTCVVF